MARQGPRAANHAYQTTAVILSVLMFGCATKNPPQTVGHVDVGRYMGVWYEVAKFPVAFERGLVGVTAEYSLEEDGRIRVKNRGFKKSFDGKTSLIEGYATVPHPEDPAKLRIKFDPFPVRYFKADYWIVDLDANYGYSVVSSPSRKMLWILSRTPSMNESQYNEIVERLAQKGFKVARLEKMPQPIDHPER
jgi:apolipoprotein D and lipocalin family protein